MRAHRNAGNRLLTRWVRWLTRRRDLTDGQSGYRAFSAAAAAAAEIVHDYNYAQVLTLDLLAKGYAYAEVPITYAFRTTGSSFVRLGTYLRKVIPAVHQGTERRVSPRRRARRTGRGRRPSSPGSRVPSGRSAATASSASAIAWWVLSWANRPSRPNVVTRSRPSTHSSSGRSRVGVAGLVDRVDVRQPADLDAGRAAPPGRPAGPSPSRTSAARSSGAGRPHRIADGAGDLRAQHRPVGRVVAADPVVGRLGQPGHRGLRPGQVVRVVTGPAAAGVHEVDQHHGTERQPGRRARRRRPAGPAPAAARWTTRARPGRCDRPQWTTVRRRRCPARRTAVTSAPVSIVAPASPRPRRARRRSGRSRGAGRRRSGPGRRGPGGRSCGRCPRCRRSRPAGGPARRRSGCREGPRASPRTARRGRRTAPGPSVPTSSDAYELGSGRVSGRVAASRPIRSTAVGGSVRASSAGRSGKPTQRSYTRSRPLRGRVCRSSPSSPRSRLSTGAGVAGCSRWLPVSTRTPATSNEAAIPPTAGARSSSSTDRPDRAARQAAASPAGPPPRTTTSTIGLTLGRGRVRSRRPGRGAAWASSSGSRSTAASARSGSTGRR